MAYAAVICLIQNLEQILHAAHSPVNLEKQDVKSLYDEISLFHAFLKDPKDTCNDPEAVKVLEIRIRDLAYKAADFIDSHIYYAYVHNASVAGRKIKWKNIAPVIYQSLSQMIEEVKSINSEIMKINYVKLGDVEILQEGNFSAGDLSRSNLNAEERMLGFGNDLIKLMHRLTIFPSQLIVIPVVGMGGIGKTTLARRVYTDPYVVHYFNIYGWVTVSPRYQAREMLLGLLGCFIKLTDEIYKRTKEELGEQLYKTLKGKKYLLVLDDLWHTKAWDILKRYFPDDKNGSRIIVTSRLTDVAVYTGLRSSPHRMHFLDADESWELLKEKLFMNEICPLELVETGKQIAARCQGLPLAVVVVAGLLNKVNKTLDCWKVIAESVGSHMNQNPGHCLDILALSYNHLPDHLKSCFLYMGAFPENIEIPCCKLIWLWVAEGFVLPARGKCLEEVAEEYLEDLVDRNLILVGKRGSNGRIKTCYIHDLLRDLCLRESQNEKFLHVIKRYAPVQLIDPNNQRRISLHANIFQFVYSKHSIPLTRSFLCFDVGKIWPSLFLLDLFIHVDFKLLMVLDILLLHSNHFPIALVDLVHLRYLAIAVNCELPGSISNLRNLQTLIVDHNWEGQNLPREIWNMSELRHIHFKRGCSLPSPLIGCKSESKFLVLQNLQTLSTILGPVSCTKEVFSCIPSLRKLGIYVTESENTSSHEWWSKYFSNLVCLDRLETLKCYFLYRQKMHRLPQCDIFPSNLKKFTLCGSNLPWEDMSTLGKLPNLEVLKLRHYAFQGDTWVPNDGEFCRLKFLLIESKDLVFWYANSTHFPILQQLVLRECDRLIGIPSDIAEIPTLQIIELHDCSMSAASSARKMQQQQQSLGNDEPIIQITWGYNYPRSNLLPAGKNFLDDYRGTSFL